jgi:phage/plasmid-like protein (TIGR03299 family)
MAYTNEVPWHGLGTYIEDAPSINDMLIKAGLDWEVEKRPISLAGDNDEIEGFYALTRDRDNKVFDIVGNRYKPTQNAEAFEFFSEFVEAGDATMETAGSLCGGKMVWGLAKLHSSFKLANDDKVEGYLLVASPHEGGKSLIIKFTTVRVVCNNTITLALSRQDGSTFRMPHVHTFDEDMINQAKVALGIAREQMKQFEKNARTLKKTKMSDAEVISLFGDVYQPDVEKIALINKFEDTASPRVQRLYDVYRNAPGADPGNAWGALNALTYYTDHLASRSSDKRLSNAWMGKAARVKQMVFNSLMQKAA